MTKQFNIDLVSIPQCHRESGEVRYYTTPEGNRYPSVTTVIDAIKDKAFLKEWQDRVGADEAERIRNAAADRGTELHEMCELTVTNQPVDLSKYLPTSTHLFGQFIPILDKYVDNIRLVEGKLYSDSLKIAGTADLAGSFAGRKAIIDFKTSLKTKRIEWIEDYFLQTAIYSYMLYERAGIYHPWLVIIIGVENQNTPQVFVQHIDDWLGRAQEAIKKYYQLQLAS